MDATLASRDANLAIRDASSALSCAREDAGAGGGATVDAAGSGDGTPGDTELFPNAPVS